MKISRSAFVLLLMAATVSPLATVEARTVSTAPFAENSASKMPAVVFLLRHAEKPLGDDKDPNLTPQGFKRAMAIPSLFVAQPGSGTARLPRPDAIFATAPAKHSNRPVETITPLAQTVHLKINEDYEDIEAAPLAKLILGGKYAGKVVVICWHHGEIPHVAQALGVVGAPKKWDADVFDQIWKIEWVDGKAQMTVVPEHLLPGDTGSN